MLKKLKQPSIAIKIGFGTVLLLMGLLVIVFMIQMNQHKSNISRIVQHYNLKIELASSMRDAIRLRQISLFSMLSMEDIFERDEELMRFYAYARQYSTAREILETLSMDELEREIHRQIRDQVRVAQPLNRIAAESMFSNVSHKEIKKVVNDAILEQNKLLNYLEDLVNLQKAKGQEINKRADSDYQFSILVIFVLGMAVIAIALTIARTVAHYVERSSAELTRAYEDAESATHAKSQFLANMSHEIRTPITAIIGFSEFLLENDTDKTYRSETIKTIIRSSKHLLQIINDILDISKIEASKLSIERAWTSPFQILQDVEVMFSSQAREKGLSFNIEYEFPLPKQIFTDSIRLTQILLNLCANAVKFTEKGMVQITVHADTESEQVYFEIKDTGIGMSPEQQQNIFRIFTQADASITRKYGGTGLGLTLSKQLANMLGGDISVQSHVEWGSRFILSIDAGDIRQVEYFHRKEELKLENIEKANAHKIVPLSGRILLAEDHPDNQKLISLMIEKIGAEVTVVENGQRAVEFASKNEYNLILMDMQMPVMDGLEASRQIKRKGSNVPIIALTANAMKKDKDACITAGCEEFIPKPIDRMYFYNVLARYLPQKSNPDQSQPMRSLLLEDDPSFVDLVQKFIDGLPNMIENLTNLSANNQWDDLKKEAHKLKGTAGGMGYPSISELAARIERQASEEDPGDFEPSLKKLAEFYQQVRDGLALENLDHEYT